MGRVFNFTATILFLSSAAAQQPVTVQRDPQAMTILNSSLDAAGGINAIAAIQDFAASGTITYYWAGKPVTGPVTLGGDSTGQFRLDTLIPGKENTCIVSRGAGQCGTSTNSSAIPADNALAFIALTLPFPVMFSAFSDSTATVSYSGTSAIQGGQAHRIRIQLPRRPKALARELLVDSLTFLPIEATSQVEPSDGTPEFYVQAIKFSDYRQVTGLMVPFAVEEYISGQRTWRIDLGSIRFNTGELNFHF